MFEKFWMAERKFDHFADILHLFVAATDIIVSYSLIFIIFCSVDRVTLGEKNSFFHYYAKLWGVYFHDLEFNGVVEVALNSEAVSLVDGTICVFEVWNQEQLDEVSGDTFNCVSKWQDVDLGGIFYVRTSMH